MNANQGRGNGQAGAGGPGIGQQFDNVGHTAQQLVDEARGAVQQLGQSLDLKGRVERHPYGMVLAAFGVGYVLGGGLFTPTTARVVRLGMKLAALPLVKDELLGFAEQAVDGFTQQARAPRGTGDVGHNPQSGGSL
jgi:hypothetical protein